MATIIHFVDVGQGNMVLIETDDGRKLVFDCNVKEDNEARVLNYIAKQIGEGKALHAFICSHRDADHVRGVKKLHARFPIQEVWDSDYPGTTTDSAEYREYMELRRRVGSNEIKKQTRKDFGRTRLRYMSAKDERLPDNANAQGIVIKAEQRDGGNESCSGKRNVASRQRCGYVAVRNHGRLWGTRRVFRHTDGSTSWVDILF